VAGSFNSGGIACSRLVRIESAVEAQLAGQLRPAPTRRE
jgi:hypothetical protein